MRSLVFNNKNCMHDIQLQSIIHFLGISLIKYNDNDKQECNNIMISFNNKSITISSDINCDDVTYEQGMTMQ